MLNNGLSITKKDYAIGAFVGLFTGILTFFIFSFLGIDFKFQKEFFLLGIPLLWALGVWLGKFLGKWISFFNQFGKFATVGFLNSTIDFSILNLVSSATGISAGFVVGWINIPGFLVATLNGYLWNKYWVFSVSNGNKSDKVFKNFPKFFGITTIGLLINSGLIIFLTTFTGPFFDISPQIWLNISKVAATAVVFVWNFIGYKYFAFYKHE